jgi:hypothetical protein
MNGRMPYRVHVTRSRFTDAENGRRLGQLWILPGDELGTDSCTQLPGIDTHRRGRERLLLISLPPISKRMNAGEHSGARQGQTKSNKIRHAPVCGTTHRPPSATITTVRSGFKIYRRKHTVLGCGTSLTPLPTK